MKQASPELKSWIDLVHKSLLIVSTSIAILTAAFKGAEYLSSKAAQVNAAKEETIQRVEALEMLTSTYTSLLTQLDRDIKDLDEKMSGEVWKDSIGWEKFSAVREAKVRDRNALLQSLGSQIVQLKQAEIPPKE